MALTDLDGAAITNMESATTAGGVSQAEKNESGYAIDSKSTDVAEYIAEWNKWHGFYRKIAEVKSNIDKLATWVVGKGYKADERTKKILDKITGAGKDSFNTILHNCVRTYKICGDSYSEIIKDKAGRLINIKPIDPGTIRITAENGRISKYEQVGMKDDEMIVLNVWDPKEIFHLSDMRIADEIHGVPTSEKIESAIKKRHQAMDDMSVVFHRYVKPLIVSYVDTDDPTEISAYNTKLDNAVKGMENMTVPKDVVDRMERISIPQFSTLDPLPWIKMLQEYYTFSEGIPDIIKGVGAETTEATSKIIYLAFQQTIEYEQLYVEEQVRMQLGLDINLEFPASIDPSLLTDARKNTGDDVKDVNPTQQTK